MKKMKRMLSLLAACFFVLALVPAGLVRADENLPSYLNYEEATAIERNVQVYKDKTILKVYKRDTNSRETYYYDNGQKKQLEEDFEQPLSDTTSLLVAKDGSYKVFDLEKGQVTGNPNYYNQVKELILNKYFQNPDEGYSYPINISKTNWYRYSTSVDDFTVYEGIVTPNKNIVQLDRLSNIFANVVSNNVLYGIQEKYVDNGYTYAPFLTTIDANGVKNEYAIDTQQVLENTMFIKDGKIYVEKINTNTHSWDTIGLYELNLDGGKATIGKKVLDCKKDDLAQDKDGQFWTVDNGYVQKFENSQWVKKYKVAEGMNALTVYDENNMVVQGIDYGANTYTTMYTIINNHPATPEGPSNPTTPTNDGGQTGNNSGTTPSVPQTSTTPNPSTENGQVGGNNGTTPSGTETPVGADKVEIGAVNNGVLPITVKSINKDNTNTVDASSSGNASKIEVTIADGKSIKGGKGSVQVKTKQDSLINLPFESIDQSLLSDTAKVVFNATVEDNTDVVKGLKAVNKLYSFDLTVVDGDKKTSVHKFANGCAEITLTLSDEELKGLDKSKLAVFYYNEETKKFELMETKVDGNKINFKTPHFSKFIIAEKTTSSTGSSNGTSVLPKTGSSISSHSLTIIGVLFIILGTITLCVKRYEKVKGIN